MRFWPISEKLRQRILCKLHLRVRPAHTRKDVAKDFIRCFWVIVEPFNSALTYRKGNGVSRRPDIAFDLGKNPLIRGVLVGPGYQQGASGSRNDIHRSGAAVDCLLALLFVLMMDDENGTAKLLCDLDQWTELRPDSVGGVDLRPFSDVC